MRARRAAAAPSENVGSLGDHPQRSLRRPPAVAPQPVLPRRSAEVGRLALFCAPKPRVDTSNLGEGSSPPAVSDAATISPNTKATTPVSPSLALDRVLQRPSYLDVAPQPPHGQLSGLAEGSASLPRTGIRRRSTESEDLIGENGAANAVQRRVISDATRGGTLRVQRKSLESQDHPSNSEWALQPTSTALAVAHGGFGTGSANVCGWASKKLSVEEDAAGQLPLPGAGSRLGRLLPQRASSPAGPRNMLPATQPGCGGMS